jgi:hypothetical protein
MAVLYDLLAGPGPADARAGLRPVAAAAPVAAGQEVA